MSRPSRASVSRRRSSTGLRARCSTGASRRSSSAGALLLLGHASIVAVLIATVLWGLAFGGSSAQLQSALTRSGREHSDVANSFLPVAFNLAIFAGGVLGALLLGTFDGLILPVVMIALGLAALLLTIVGRRSAFAAG